MLKTASAFQFFSFIRADKIWVSYCQCKRDLNVKLQKLHVSSYSVFPRLLTLTYLSENTVKTKRFLGRGFKNTMFLKF